MQCLGCVLYTPRPLYATEKLHVSGRQSPTAEVTAGLGLELWMDACRGRARHELPEQAVRLPEGPRREEERRRRPGRRAVAERNRPQAVDPDRLPASAEELAARPRLTVALEAVEVEGVNVTVAKVSHEQRAAELPEIGWGDGQPPRRVEPPSRGHAPEQIAVGVERVHESVAHARDIVVLVLILERVGDVDLAGEAADAKRRIARR